MTIRGKVIRPNGISTFDPDNDPIPDASEPSMPYFIALSLLAGAVCGWRIRFPAFATVSVGVAVATFAVTVTDATAGESLFVAIEVMVALQAGYVVGLVSQAIMRP